MIFFNKLTYSFLLIFSCLSLSSQSLTFQTGYTGSGIITSSGTSSPLMNGFNGSLNYDLREDKILGFRGGVEIATRGARLQSTGPFAFDFSFLTLVVQSPLYLSVNLLKDDKGLKIFTGPSLGAHMLARDVNGNAIDIGNQGLRRLSVNYDLGVALKLNRLSLGYSYSRGLSNLTDDTANPWTNYAHSITLGYRIFNH